MNEYLPLLVLSAYGALLFGATMFWMRRSRARADQETPSEHAQPTSEGLPAGKPKSALGANR